MNRENGRLRIALGAILFLLLLQAGAGAEKDVVLRASCPSRGEETVVSVNGYRGTMLAIPGYWDPAEIVLEIDGSAYCALGTEKKVIRAGEAADLREYLNTPVPVYDEKNRNRGPVTIYRGSDIPALFLAVDGGELKRVRSSKNNVITQGRAVWAEADGTVLYDGAITQLKGRGNNTFSYSKKPYQVKLARKAALTGTGGGKTWVLLANWNDVSLLRNQIMLDMARETGLRFAVSCAQTDVWINGEYQGLYLVTEKIQIKPERMALKDLEEETKAVNEAPADSFSVFKTATDTLPLVRGYRVPENPEDITGGYIASVEKYARLRDYAEPGFRTQYGLSVRIVEPTCPSREQTEYLGSLVDEMHRAILAKDGTEPRTGKPFAEYMDVPSFALKFLLEEWCKNYDFIGGSQYLYKDSDSRDPLIYAGPAWDYDLCFGNMADRGTSPKGNYVTAVSRKTSNLYWALGQHDSFMDRVRQIWQDTFRPALAVLLGEAAPSEGGLVRPLDEYAERIARSAEMNFARWGVGKSTLPAAGSNHGSAVAYLKQWIEQRTEFMDGEYGKTDGQDR